MSCRLCGYDEEIDATGCPNCGAVEKGATPEEPVAKKSKKKSTVKKSPAGNVSIADLLKQLEKATDPVEKRKLRVKLRKAGHTGGLRQNGIKTKKTAGAGKKKTTAGATSKKKTSKEK